MTTVLVSTVQDDKGTATLDFHKERANGTTRHLPTYRLGTPERETGEWILVQREEGRTMRDIATEMSVSVPTARRMLNATLLSQEVEDGEYEEFLQAPATTDEAPATPATPAKEEATVAA